MTGLQDQDDHSDTLRIVLRQAARNAMDVFHFRNFEAPGPHQAVLTIGNFDGVHIGHQALIRQVVRDARQMGVQCALLTFQPHPQSVLQAHPPPIITSIAMRRRLFQQLGLDAAFFIPFTREFARKSPETFVRQYLLAYFRIKKLIVGFDFQFGHERRGSAEILRGLSEEFGFQFEIFPQVSLGEEKVSSSNIRAALAEADFARAERLLGRPFSVLEEVQRGEQRGRGIGFPTVNQVPAEPLPLSFGVYASRVIVQERTYGAVSNYGVKPTVGTDKPLLESYLFDFDGQIYGELAEVFPLRQLRSERKFPSLDALKRQIAVDRDGALSYLDSL
ncbi:MAG: riboflavin biosynthesis protein RibF [SAR324 cluster bacterium]|nr:riboflavin biosynthesis protein RibF [SAR324 cluster bacterium]